MSKETKPAVKSTTVAGGILALLGSIGSYLEAAGKLPVGGAAPIVGAIGALLSLIGRLRSDIKPITGLFR
jgi:hypothetical protein